MKEEPKFFEKVYDVVDQIPEGKVASYGQVAGMLGNPRLARHVGYALRRLTLNEREVPWWRVVNAKGYISINQNEGGVEKVEQKALLKDEGVEFVNEWTVDMKRCGWRE